MSLTKSISYHYSPFFFIIMVLSYCSIISALY
nr:MAG TPA: hypothetical protein [Caudoviricetes sp.]